jgi:hypothetical protein
MQKQHWSQFHLQDFIRPVTRHSTIQEGSNVAVLIFYCIVQVEALQWLISGTRSLCIMLGQNGQKHKFAHDVSGGVEQGPEAVNREMYEVTMVGRVDRQG